MQKSIISPVLVLCALTFLASCTAIKSQTTTHVDSPVVSTTLANSPSTTSLSTSVISSTKSKNITYVTPEWSATAAFSLSVEDGTITAVSASIVSWDRESRQYITRFASGISRAVVGKKVAEVSLDTLGGASLTTEAFTRFLASVS